MVRLADPQLAAQIRDRYPGFGLPQNPTDLLLAESRSLHTVLLHAVVGTAIDHGTLV